MSRKKLLGILAFILIILLIFIGLILALRSSPKLIQGELELEEIDVGAKVAGRIGEIYVKEGDIIDVGTPLLKMNSPEIDAKMKQAKGASDAADAVALKAEDGARPQEVAMAKQTWLRAQAGADLAEKSYRRVNNLAKEGLVSLQSRDEAYANLVNNQNQAKAAKEQYNMAQEGARKEDIMAAQAQARQVQGVVDEAQVAEDEANLKSPVPGIVVNVIGKEGEIMPQGVPIITIAKPNMQTIYFNVKESDLSNFKVGNIIKAVIPALSDKKYSFKITYLSVLADFATWRPTRNNEGYDIRTFEIQAKPLQPIDNARSGMSVIIRY